MKKTKMVLLSLLYVLFVIYPAVPAHAASFNIGMQGLAFQPPNLTINVGDTVTWTNNEVTPHTSTSGSGCTSNGLWDSGTLSRGQSFSVTFTTPGTFPYFCSFHCGSGMVGSITVTAPGAGMAVPDSPVTHVFSAVASPVVSPDPAMAQPIGVGTAASGGTSLGLHIGLPQFAGVVDVYFLLFVPALDPNNIYQVTGESTLHPVAQGLAPLFPGITGPVNTPVFGEIPTTLLPHGDYFFGVLVTPGGDTSLTKFYLWVTEVAL